MTLRSTLALLLMTGVASIVQASVTVNVTADLLRDQTGLNAASVNTVVALVADTNNDGVTAFAGSLPLASTYNFSTTPVYLDNSFNSDLILGLRTLGANSGTAGVYGDAFGSGGPGDPLLTFTGNWGAGDNLYLVWFPTYTTTPTTMALGDYYGRVLLGATPSDMGVASLDYWTTDDSGSFSGIPGSGTNAPTIANLQVQGVPEPSSFLVLAGLGFAGFLGRRVRRPANKG